MCSIRSLPPTLFYTLLCYILPTNLLSIFYYLPLLISLSFENLNRTNKTNETTETEQTAKHVILKTKLKNYRK